MLKKNAINSGQGSSILILPLTRFIFIRLYLCCTVCNVLYARLDRVYIHTSAISMRCTRRTSFSRISSIVHAVCRNGVRVYLCMHICVHLHLYPFSKWHLAIRFWTWNANEKWHCCHSIICVRITFVSLLPWQIILMAGQFWNGRVSHEPNE